MAAKIIELPKPSDQWQFTVDVFRRRDGTFAARLVDARTSLIESGYTDSSAKLHEIANMLEQSAGPMRADAELLK
jgi:hypothetical protein